MLTAGYHEGWGLLNSDNRRRLSLNHFTGGGRNADGASWFEVSPGITYRPLPALIVNPSIRCRHTVGLNWTAIGIEHVGFRDADLMGRRAELRASLRLTRYLRCRYGIPVKDVIGHNESLSSPYHRERVKALRHQTHGDMRHASMVVYRRKLRALGGCG